MIRSLTLNPDIALVRNFEGWNLFLLLLKKFRLKLSFNGETSSNSKGEQRKKNLLGITELF